MNFQVSKLRAILVNSEYEKSAKIQQPFSLHLHEPISSVWPWARRPISVCVSVTLFANVARKASGIHCFGRILEPANKEVWWHIGTFCAQHGLLWLDVQWRAHRKVSSLCKIQLRKANYPASMKCASQQNMNAM